MSGAYTQAQREDRLALLRTIQGVDERIADAYREAADTLAHTAGGSKTLTARWQREMSLSLNDATLRLRNDISSAVLGGVQTATGMPGQTAADWFDKVLQRTNGGDFLDTTFRSMLTRTSDEAMRAVVSGMAYLDGKSLSQRIWTATSRTEGGINHIIEQGIAQHRSAYQIAKDLQTYVDPDAKKPWDWHKVYPDIPFPVRVDYNAQRLARTSINHAYHMAMRAAADANPFATAIHWELSDAHYERQVKPFGEDECDEYAEHDEGLGTGNFDKNNVPLPHPCCLCFQYAVVPDSLDDCATRLRGWMDGGNDPELDEDFSEWQDRNGFESGTTDPAPTVISSTKGTYAFYTGSNGRATVKERAAVIYKNDNAHSFVYPAGYTKANQTITPARAIEAFERLPQVLKDSVDTIVFNDRYNPDDAYWRKTYKNFTQSFATGGNRTINFWRNGYTVPDETLLGTMAHEAGHNFDNAMTTGNQRFSRGSTWLDAMKHDLLTSGKKSVTTYGENSSVEDFAEAVKTFVIDRERLSSIFKERDSILGGMIK